MTHKLRPKDKLTGYTQQLRQSVFSERYDKVPKKELTIHIRL